MQHDCESSPQIQGTRPNKHTAKQLNSNLSDTFWGQPELLRNFRILFTNYNKIRIGYIAEINCAI